MPCEVIQTPELFGGAPTFVCSHTHPGDQEPEACVFCGAAGEFLCDWPVERFVDVPVHDVRHGDVIELGCGAATGRVDEILADGPLLKFILGDQKWTNPNFAREREKRRARFGAARWPNAKECYPAVAYRPNGYWDSRGKLRILRPGTCDAPVCEAHAREVADEKHYCANHWRAWEAM